MIARNIAAAAVLAAFATAAPAQDAVKVPASAANAVEVPESLRGINYPPPVIWGSMDAFDLKQRAWREKRPTLAIERSYLEQKQQQRQASIERERIRYAQRLQDTQHAGKPPSASVGAGEPAPSPATEPAPQQ